ncbi:VPS13B [Symbiodinium natans]|uniref:VPS13B protein n=1 Tax=Symbiodinium natans TaxID=878477 RepID=A0A812K6Q9_9DINO|nr:VPS13B [Symbiodinium natans]
MLEAVLTRIILRYAQRYICDTLRTDSLSLWGGDLRVANFELRTEELARVLGTEESSIQLTRGPLKHTAVLVGPQP